MIEVTRLFVLTARHQSITKAAQELRVSQSTASRRLMQFQTGLGAKLLKKNGRGIELTSLGQAYFEEVLPISSQFDELQKKYTPDHNSIIVAASHRPSKYLLPTLMSEFSKKRSSVKLTLITRSSIEIEKLLVDSKVDLAVITNPTPNVLASSFVKELYCSEALTAFVAANNPLARMKSLRPAEMSTSPVIIKSRRDGESRTEALLTKFEKEGIKFKTVVRCDSPEVVKEFVRSGAGVGFLYYNSIKRGIERGYFKIIPFPEVDLVGQSYIVYPRGKPLSSLVNEFLSFLRASVTKELPVIPPEPRIQNRGRNSRTHQPMLGPKLLSWMFSIASWEWMSWLVA